MSKRTGRDDVLAMAEAEAAAAPAPSQDKLDLLRDSIARVRDLDLEIEDLQQRLNGKKQERFQTTNFRLPALFQEIGVTELRLDAAGNLPPYSAELRTNYHANIAADWSQERRDAAFDWLEKEGHGDLIKTTIVVELGRKERALAKKTEATLRKLGVSYRVMRAVPWNTLTAFVREQIVKYRRTPPLEKLGAVVGPVVELKPIKQED